MINPPFRPPHGVELTQTADWDTISWENPTADKHRAGNFFIAAIMAAVLALGAVVLFWFRILEPSFEVLLAEVTVLGVVVALCLPPVLLSLFGGETIRIGDRQLECEWRLGGRVLRQRRADRSTLISLSSHYIISGSDSADQYLPGLNFTVDSLRNEFMVARTVDEFTRIGIYLLIKESLLRRGWEIVFTDPQDEREQIYRHVHASLLQPGAKSNLLPAESAVNNKPAEFQFTIRGIFKLIAVIGALAACMFYLGPGRAATPICVAFGTYSVVKTIRDTEHDSKWGMLASILFIGALAGLIMWFDQ